MDKVLGMHYIAEYYDCENTIINNCCIMQEVMLNAARLSGATIINHHFHEFSPHGISGVIIIAESHFAMHTWPEHNYVAVDLFSCGDFNYKDTLGLIQNELKAKRSVFSSIKRGQVFDRDEHRQDITAERFYL